jgi:hypothetical protein
VHGLIVRSLYALHDKREHTPPSSTCLRL